jgi:hypothetical protein
MSMSSGRFYSGRGAWTALAALLLLTVFFGASIPARAQSASDTSGDYGDAPDATNHSGFSMRAYPWNVDLEIAGFSEPPAATADYPTVVQAGSSGPHGPWHRNPRARAWLGSSVSKEANADLLPDQDGGTSNITPSSTANSGYANQYVEDDALVLGYTISLPNCAMTRLAYSVSGAEGVSSKNYVNVWLDFNRDGDFDDTTILCRDFTNNLISVPEHAVANHQIEVVPGLQQRLMPFFWSSHPAYDEMIWMRITLTGQPIPASSDDGSGPPEGYVTGETEDYLMTNQEEINAFGRQALGTDTNYHEIDVTYYTGGY